MISTVLLVFVLGSFQIAAGVDNKTQAILNAASYLQRDAFFQASDYAFDYSGADASNGLVITQHYGNATFFQIPQTPSLIGTSLGSSRFDFAPCALLQPHVHRADGQIYVLKGQIRAGFVIQSFGQLIENTLNAGMGMVFPRGSLMYFQNTDAHHTASFLATYNSNDFGVDLIVPLLFNTLPSDIALAAMGLSQTTYENTKTKIGVNQLYILNHQCSAQG